MGVQGPLVSIIIPNFNYSRYLAQAIESVLGQSYRHVEVIVIDDGSSDDSEAILRRYGDQIRWYRQARQGVAAARNRGVEVSRGELVAFLDADDFWLPLKLERQVARWVGDPEVGFVHCGARIIDEGGDTVEVQLDGQEGWVAKEMLLFRRLAIVCAGSGALMPRVVFDAIGGFDPRLSTSADWDLCYRVAVQRRVAFVPEELIVIRRHQSNMHANIHVMEQDMLLAYTKAFQGASPEIRRLRRQSYGNLHMVLGGSFFRTGQLVDAARHITTSLWLTPGNCTRLLGFPIRWWNRVGVSPGTAEGCS